MWLWWVSLVVAVSREQSLTMSLVVITINTVLVFSLKRSEQAFRTFRLIALTTIGLVAFRVVVQNLFGLPMGSTVILRLPALEIPQWLSGIRLGGPITSESVLFAVNQGLVLAAIVTSFAAASAVISAHSLLKSLPMGLHNVAMVMVIAITFIPHVLDDISRVRQAQRFRGFTARSINSIARLVVIVVETALERSVTLAASLTARGYTLSRSSRASSVSLLVFIVSLALGVVAFSFNWPNVTLLLLSALAVFSLGHLVFSSKQQKHRSRLTVESWSIQDFVLAGCALLGVVIFSLDTKLAPVGAVMGAAALWFMTHSTGAERETA